MYKVIICFLSHWLKNPIIQMISLDLTEAERSFSGLRRLKNYMRSTMKEDRLNGLALVMVHRTISVSVENIIDTFAARHTRRMRLELILNDKYRYTINYCYEFV